jgi:hypothetical protein
VRIWRHGESAPLPQGLTPVPPVMLDEASLMPDLTDPTEQLAALRQRPTRPLPRIGVGLLPALERAPRRADRLPARILDPVTARLSWVDLMLAPVRSIIHACAAKFDFIWPRMVAQWDAADGQMISGFERRTRILAHTWTAEARAWDEMERRVADHAFEARRSSNLAWDLADSAATQRRVVNHVLAGSAR